MEALSNRFLLWFDGLNNKLKIHLIFGLIAFWIAGRFLSFFEHIKGDNAFALSAFMFICYGALFYIPICHWDKETKSRINKDEGWMLIIKSTGTFVLIFPLYAHFALDINVSPKMLILYVFAPAALLSIYFMIYHHSLKLLSRVFHGWFKKILL